MKHCISSHMALLQGGRTIPRQPCDDICKRIISSIFTCGPKYSFSVTPPAALVLAQACCDMRHCIDPEHSLSVSHSQCVSVHVCVCAMFTCVIWRRVEVQVEGTQSLCICVFIDVCQHRCHDLFTKMCVCLWHRCVCVCVHSRTLYNKQHDRSQLCAPCEAFEVFTVVEQHKFIFIFCAYSLNPSDILSKSIQSINNTDTEMFVENSVLLV